ncbi:MAG: hypothetical protein IJN29_04970, partial [Akkermansia sp.]|nr:hypothetical protein [Akkermansia sp.]
MEQLQSEPPGEPNARARKGERTQAGGGAAELRNPCNAVKNNKAQGTCGDSLSPRFTGLKNMFIPQQGLHNRCAIAHPCLSSFAPEGALQFGLLRKHNENSSRSRRAASPIPARAAGR